MQEQLLWGRADNHSFNIEAVETPGDIIRRAREAKGWSQDELASEAGISQPAIVKIESGGTRKSKYFPKIAQLLEIPMELLDPSLAPAAYRAPATILGERDLPVFSAAEGGSGEMVVSTDPVEIVPRPWYLGNVREGYAVLIVGDSMSPAFEPGDMAVVNPRLPPARDRHVILVARESEGEFVATIKRLLRWTDRDWHLRQYNPRAGEKAEFTLSKKTWPKALRVVGKYER